MTKIDVLDNGFVRLVDSMGSDLSIVRAARVSYNAEWRSGENERNDIKLINYLWRNKHTTPFEAVTFTFEVKAPIFVIRQWHRHRTWSYNEVSGRYSILPNECYVPKEDKIGVQSKTNHQSRILDMMNEKANEVINASAVRLIKKANYEAFEHYNNLLIMGIPREVARMILPLNTYTHMFTTVNLLNLLKFIELRKSEHAQYEIRVYAEALLKLIENIIPETILAFKRNNGTAKME